MKVTVEQILEALEDEASVEYMEAAKSFGISADENGLKVTMIAGDEDIYMLIDKLYADQIFRGFDYLAILTTGWAAPLNENGEADCAPSQHKEKRRVSLLSCLDNNNKNMMGSAIVFHDKLTDTVFDENTATGALADALNSLFD